MGNSAEFDTSAAHRFYSTHCFNQAWEFIDKRERTEAETDDMLHAAHASAWHWWQRPDRTKKNLSISLWQLSRVYALVGDAKMSNRYAQNCLEVSQGESPFLMAYAYEALARAAAVAGDHAAAAGFLTRARILLAQVQDPEERQLLENDLDTLAR